LTFEHRPRPQLQPLQLALVTRRAACYYQHRQYPAIAQPSARVTPATCRSRVKFWFIKNYMSPQMRDFVPHMAARYDFDYEFVTYKWPSWLHKQVRRCVVSDHFMGSLCQAEQHGHMAP